LFASIAVNPFLSLIIRRITMFLLTSSNDEKAKGCYCKREDQLRLGIQSLTCCPALKFHGLGSVTDTIMVLPSFSIVA
jgi:hypothetical protein